MNNVLPIWRRILRIPVPGPSWGAAMFVWGIWALILVAALVNITENGNKLPYWDDWRYVPYVVGTEPITLKYLWEQDCEHRIAFTKFLYFGVLKLSGGDYRAYKFFTCVLLGGFAVALIWAAKSLRGWTSYTDAFFPLALLQGAFGELCVCDGWGTAIYVLLPLVVAGLLVITIQKGAQLTLATGILAGVGLTLLPLCCAGGIVYLPPLAFWFGYIGIRCWRLRQTQGVWTGLVILGGLLTALVVMVLYFIGFERSTYVPPASGIAQWLQASLSVATSSFGGTFAQEYWPYSGLAMLIILGISAGFLVSAVYHAQRKNHAQAVGLLFFLGASCLLALAMGWGRGGFGLVFLYLLLPLPILLCLYFIWGLPKPGAISFCGQACLFAALCFAASVNIPAGLVECRRWHAATASLEKDLRSGVPPYLLIARYGEFLGGGAPNYSIYEPYMRMLQRAGFGPFRYLKDDPPFRQVALSLGPAKVIQAANDRGEIRTTDPEPYVTLNLPKPMFVACIQVMNRTHDQTGGEDSDEGLISVSWKRQSHADFPEVPQAGNVWAGALLAIGDRIDQVRIQGNPSCLHKLSKVVLLVPDA